MNLQFIKAEFMTIRKDDSNMSKPKVAFICTHNSCRSQIAEALGRHLAGDVFESYSAGTVLSAEYLVVCEALPKVLRIGV